MDRRNLPKKKRKPLKGLIPGLIAGGAAFGLTALIIDWLGGRLSIGGGLISILIGGIVGVLAGIMGSGLDTSTHNRQNRKKEPDPLTLVLPQTGNSDADSLLEEGYTLLRELRGEREKLGGELTEKLTELEKRCVSIFRAVEEKPARAPQIRKFLNYYLPTALKLTRVYGELDQKCLSEEQTEQSRKNLADSIGAVTEGCKSLLSKLYQDDVIDMKAEMDVLEQMLKRDGLSVSSLEAAVRQAKMAAQIDRQVDQRIKQRHRDQYTQEGLPEQRAEKQLSAVPAYDSGSPRAFAAAGQSEKKKDSFQK